MPKYCSECGQPIPSKVKTPKMNPEEPNNVPVKKVVVPKRTTKTNELIKKARELTEAETKPAPKKKVKEMPPIPEEDSSSEEEENGVEEEEIEDDVEQSNKPVRLSKHRFQKAPDFTEFPALF